MQTFKTAALSSIDEFEHIYHNQPSEVELAEICGGVARTSRLAARRRKQHGPNFDMVVGVDLTVPSTQKQVLKYFQTVTVLVPGMAPVCTHYGPLSNLNWSIDPEAMVRRLEVARRIATLCGTG